MRRPTGCESTPDDSVLCTHLAAPEAARRAATPLVPGIALAGPTATAKPAACRGRQAGGNAQATAAPTPDKNYSNFI